MTVEENFSKIAAHMRKGLIVHDKIAQGYAFLNLCGYQKNHEYHYLHESKSYQHLINYYIKNYNKLIPYEKFEEPEIIPEKWYKHLREDADSSTKRNGVQMLIKTWISWEKETKTILEESYKQLNDLNEFSAAQKIMEFLNDVNNEIIEAEEKYLSLEAVSYDLIFILEEQRKGDEQE